ncbi:MAG: peptide deformylase [Calditrichaeota bacterium]|nr:peptide deformylase [Calditrichota bacterium]
MLLKVIPYGDPLLRRHSAQVDAIDAEVKRLIADMIETMQAAGGVGLAAPQVGRSLQLFLIDWGAMQDGAEAVAYLNPEVLQAGGANVSKEEGCLSLPKVFAQVTRPDKVKVRYQTLDGRTVEETLKDLPARVFQHELDHLNGVLFIDRLTADIRKGLKEGLQSILDGRVVPFDPDRPETMQQETRGEAA